MANDDDKVESPEDLAKAEREGREQREKGKDHPSHSAGESEQIKNARERGFEGAGSNDDDEDDD